MARAALAMLASVFALAAPASAQEPAANVPEWDYDEALQTAREHLSHPARWDLKIVVYYTRTLIIENEKRRTGTIRYFVVTRRKRDGGLRLRWHHPPLATLIVTAEVIDGQQPPV